jgi:di/tripeptidase
VVGDRPAGALPADDGLVELLIKVQRSLGIVPKLRAGSTDANIPLSRGLPAVTIGITTGGHTHAPGEYLDIPPMVTGVLQVFEAALALAGLRADC